MWKGALQFGLVSIPVRLYAATEEKNVRFHQVHKADAGRIRYKRVCEVFGNEIPYADIGKGYETPSGEVVVLTDEDFEDLPVSTSRAIDVMQFVPLEQVDPIYFSRSYYLEPDRTGTKPYVLLRQALEDSGRVGIVKIALRQRESLATLRVRDGVFVVELMLWPDEVRTADFEFLDEDIDLRKQELSMAGSLIDTMSGDFDPSEFADEYRRALEERIDAKIEGREVTEEPEPTARGEKVVDLVEALEASVKAASAPQGRRRQSTERSDDGRRRASGSRSSSGGSSRKSSGKKAASKSGSKTASGRKSASRTRKSA
jgi:DNA end-binding protein Ku